ncbi:uncharacterized protein LOC101859196 [Aplysia californica]|uniref:Uncharacterized protein LOC101859196 n=1 Tax=Aplysia californica TaxID=6500 RepID=A0ABM1VZV1_APLCA|nr:uncharacterized protein LOC101859196 [Aplysia californica]
MTSELKSLFHICLDYISKSLNHVESLHGFPDVVGKQIFESATQRGHFSNLRSKESSLKDLQLFFTAYGTSGILERLDLRNCQLFLNDTVDDHWWLYHGLTRLNLTACGLGDSHDLLPQLTTMNRLKTLVLRNNGLSDEGIRKMTTRMRMYGLSSVELTHLDLSENIKITSRSLKFLVSFRKLQVLNATNTAIRVTEPHSLWKRHDDTCPDVIDCWEVGTSGWAAQVVDSWVQEYENPVTGVTSGRSGASLCLRQTSGSDEITTSFYPKKRLPVNVTSSLDSPARGVSGCLFLMSPFVQCTCRRQQGTQRSSVGDSRGQRFSQDSLAGLGLYVDEDSDFEFSIAPHKKRKRKASSEQGLPSSPCGSCPSGSKCSKACANKLRGVPKRQMGSFHEIGLCDFENVNNSGVCSTERNTESERENTAQDDSAWLLSQYTKGSPKQRTSRNAKLSLLNKMDGFV